MPWIRTNKFCRTATKSHWTMEIDGQAIRHVSPERFYQPPMDLGNGSSGIDNRRQVSPVPPSIGPGSRPCLLCPAMHRSRGPRVCRSLGQDVCRSLGPCGCVSHVCNGPGFVPLTDSVCADYRVSLRVPIKEFLQLPVKGSMSVPVNGLQYVADLRPM